MEPEDDFWLRQHLTARKAKRTAKSPVVPGKETIDNIDSCNYVFVYVRMSCAPFFVCIPSCPSPHALFLFLHIGASDAELLSDSFRNRFGSRTAPLVISLAVVEASGPGHDRFRGSTTFTLRIV